MLRGACRCVPLAPLPKCGLLPTQKLTDAKGTTTVYAKKLLRVMRCITPWAWVTLPVLVCHHHSTAAFLHRPRVRGAHLPAKFSGFRGPFSGFRGPKTHVHVMMSSSGLSSPMSYHRNAKHPSFCRYGWRSRNESTFAMSSSCYQTPRQYAFLPCCTC